jgi:hypothetical protein
VFRLEDGAIRAITPVPTHSPSPPNPLSQGERGE